MALKSGIYKEFLALLARLKAYLAKKKKGVNDLNEKEKRGLIEDFSTLVHKGMPSLSESSQSLEKALGQYKKQAVKQAESAFKEAQVEHAFTPSMIDYKAKEELKKQLNKGIGLIKLNREETVLKFQKRFYGWLNFDSDPDRLSLDEVEDEFKKTLSSLNYEQRRVEIDQGQKLLAGISKAVSESNGAIGAIWRSNYKSRNYDYRESHKERDGRFYIIRGTEDDKAGYLKGTYTDEITQPAEEVNCQCFYRYVYFLEDVPKENLTRAGLDNLNNG